MLARLGRWCFIHRWASLGVWLVVLIGTGTLAWVVGASYETNPSLPDSESTRGFAVIDEYFGGAGSGGTGTIVFEAEQGITEVEAELSSFIDQVRGIDGVVSVESPYDPGGEAQIAAVGELAGKVAFASVNLGPEVGGTAGVEIGQEIAELIPEVEGVRVEIGGQILAEFEPPTAELIGIAFAIVILILSFGSVLAMGLPIGMALFGVGIGVSLIALMSNVGSFPDFTTTIGAMIGLGVGIDYALFIVTRYREGLHAGLEPVDATSNAIATAGRAVVLAGLTVVVSLLGMLLMGVAFINGMGIGAATTVAVTIITSLTLLPALLGFAGDRLELTRYRGLIAAALVAVALLGVGLGVPQLGLAAVAAVAVLLIGLFWAPLKKKVPQRQTKEITETRWFVWSKQIQHHPWPVALGCTALLIVLALPMLSLRLGFSDEGNFPSDTTTRQAYDLLADGFGAGFNGPLIAVGELADPAEAATVDTLRSAIAADPGVAAVSPPFFNDPSAPEAVLIRVIPTTSPQDQATVELVERLRDDVVPTTTIGTGLDVNITGEVALSVDFTELLASRLPVFIGVVLALSFLLLMVMFRSLLVPLKSVIMNLLSIAAAYGIVVAIFQWGWMSDVFGIDGGAPIEPFVPMMLFAIVFGLSMDYEVFLLSRIREDFDRTGNAQDSVANGLAVTAQVITAAAAIMVVVFGSFMLDPNRVIKLFGAGLALAVLIDATLVRLLLVPATMELLGERNWWLPRWLDKILPELRHEG